VFTQRCSFAIEVSLNVEALRGVLGVDKMDVGNEVICDNRRLGLGTIAFRASSESDSSSELMSSIDGCAVGGGNVSCSGGWVRTSSRKT
jgi:hypothetical protein